MLDAKNLLRATLDTGRALMRFPGDGVELVSRSVHSPVLIPIRSLGVNHRDRIARHLMELSAQDRYLRFGFAAQDSHIARYVAGLDFERDEIFGIYNRKLRLLAVAHLAYSVDVEFQRCAEFGVSVCASARGRQYGKRLFDRAAMHARNDGVDMMFIHALSENSIMLNIAREAGARVERDGTESEAFLYLPKATLDSRLSELVEEQVALTDYRIKHQAKQFWRVLSHIQRIRRNLNGDDVAH